MNIPNKRNSLLFPVHFSFIPVIFFLSVFRWLWFRSTKTVSDLFAQTNKASRRKMQRRL